MATCTLEKCVLLRRTTGVKLLKGMCSAARLQPQEGFLRGEKHRSHPGLTNVKMLQLPEELQVAAKSIIDEAKIPQLQLRVQKLTNFLWSRKRQIDDYTLKKKALGLEKEIWEKAMRDTQDVDEEALNDKVRRRVLSELKKTTYHWTPLKYDEEMGVVYMAARLAGSFAAIGRALNEIKKRDHAFAPHSLLDFGSGLGTVAWASHALWGDSLNELVCVDSSGPMNVLAERLLKGDDEKAEPHFKHVYFRQFLPVSPKVQYDLVVAAFTLSELPTTTDREEALFTLWRKTGSYLVLVENGTKDGHQMLMDARHALLMKQEEILHDPRPASVFAPCPHKMMCPKLARDPVTPCNFNQKYHPLPLLKHATHQTEKFSYLIFTRNESAEEKRDDEVMWCRLIAPVLRRNRHVHCRMCGSDGELRHAVVTARKNSKDVYRCARNSDWGDLVPFMQSAKTEEVYESEEEEDDRCCIRDT